MAEQTTDKYLLLKTKLEEIEDQKNKEYALRRDCRVVSISTESYDTNHLERLKEERKKRLDELEELIKLKSAASKKSSAVIVAICAVIIAVLLFVLPGVFKIVGAVAVVNLCVVISIIKSDKARKNIDRMRDDESRRYRRDRDEAAEADEKEKQRYQKAVERAKKRKQEELREGLADIDKNIAQIRREIADLGIITLEDLDLTPNILRDLENTAKTENISFEGAVLKFQEAKRRKIEEEIARREALARKEFVESPVYRGLNWNLTELELNEEKIKKLELDSEALLYSYTKVRPGEERGRILDSWFCLTVMDMIIAGVQENAETKAVYKRMLEKLEATGSWKLRLLASALDAAGFNALAMVTDPSKITDVCEYIKRNGVRSGETSEEKRYYSNVINGCNIAFNGVGNFLKASAKLYGKDTVSRTNPADADRRAYIVLNACDADQKVYFTDKKKADIKYYIVSDLRDADIKIYPVNNIGDADIKVLRMD